MEGGAIAQFLPLILIFAIMYFLLIRPQQKKMKEHQKMVGALRRGDQVVTGNFRPLEPDFVNVFDHTIAPWQGWPGSNVRPYRLKRY